MKKNAIIFDLDGTIIDSSEGIINSAIDTFEQMGLLCPDRNIIKSCIGPPIGNSIGAKLGFSNELITNFNKLFRSIYKDERLLECTIYEGIPALLSDLKLLGYKIGIATNKREEYAKIMLQKMGLDIYFDNISGMDETGMMKKSDIIVNCANILDEKYDKIVMVGDTDNDYNSANSNNIDFIGVSYGFGFKKQETRAFPIVDTPAKLKNVILTEYN